MALVLSFRGVAHTSSKNPQTYTIWSKFYYQIFLESAKFSSIPRLTTYFLIQNSNPHIHSGGEIFGGIRFGQVFLLSKDFQHNVFYTSYSIWPFISHRVSHSELDKVICLSQIEICKLKLIWMLHWEGEIKAFIKYVRQISLTQMVADMWLFLSIRYG